MYTPAPWHRAPEITGGPLRQWLAWVLVDQSQSELEAGRLLSLEAASNRPELGGLSDGELVERCVSLQPLCRVLASQHLNQLLAASIGPSIIAAVCDEIGMPTNASRLIAGLGEIDSAAPARVLWTLSRQVRASAVLGGYFDGGLANLHRRLASSPTVEVVGFLAGFNALLHEVGFRGGDEWSLHGVAWEQDTEAALAVIERMRRLPDAADPGIGHAQRSTERELLIKEVGEIVAAHPVARDHFDASVAATRIFTRGRDRAKANVTRVVHEMRLALAELASRAVHHSDVAEPGNLHMLFADELAYYADGGLADIRAITDQRRAHFDALVRVSPPPVLKAPPSGTGVRPIRPVAPLERHLEAGEVLFGRTGAAGMVRGRARIVADPADIVATQAGDILVAATTNPSWAAFLPGAAGLVLENGSALSHAAVACRELGQAAVVAVTGAASRIADGSIIEVDGVTGIVTVLEGPATAGEELEPGRMAIDPWGARTHDAASW